LPSTTFWGVRGLGFAFLFWNSCPPALPPWPQTPAGPPLRFGAVYLPNGCVMDYWMPKTPQGVLEITPVLKPLEPFQNQMTVIGNLSRAGGKYSTDHAVSSAGWLTGALAKQTEAEDIRVGIG